MSEHGVLDAFASHAFLQRLSEKQRMLLATGVRPFQVKEGDYLTREGQEASKFYLIQEGHVRIDAHMPQDRIEPIQTLGPGDVVGWSWLVPPHRWQLDARATEPVQGLLFDAEWLREKCEQDHTLGYHLLRELVTVVSARLFAARHHMQVGP